MNDLKQTLAEMLLGIRFGRDVKTTSWGWIYIVHLVPDLSKHRVKIGFTKHFNARMSGLRNTCPNLKLWGRWRATEQHEQLVHTFVPGRVGTSEVFDCPNIDLVGIILDALLGDRSSVATV